VSLDERPRGSTRPTPKVHYNSLPRTSIEGALGSFSQPLRPLGYQGKCRLLERPPRHRRTPRTKRSRRSFSAGPRVQTAKARNPPLSRNRTRSHTNPGMPQTLSIMPSALIIGATPNEPTKRRARGCRTQPANRDRRTETGTPSPRRYLDAATHR
jgi:hypothetical protein